MMEPLEATPDRLAGGEPLPVSEGLKLIKMAASSGATAVPLMEQVASGAHYPEYVPALVSVFSGLSLSAKEVALRLLADIGTLESLLAFLYLLKEYARTGREPERPITQSLIRNPKYPDVLFPAMLELAANAALAPLVGELCLAYFRQGLLRISAIVPYAAQLLSAYGTVRNRLRSAWNTGEVHSDAYRQLRQQAALYLDLFGWLPTAVVRTAVIEAQECPDRWLNLRAILSATQLDLPVNPDALAAVTADPETNPVLREGLDRVARLKKGKR